MHASRLPPLPSPMLSRRCVLVLWMMITVMPGSEQYSLVNAQTPQYDQTLNGLPATYYSWNPNCAAMGYDFGYKMEGCFAGTNIRFDSLERTKGASCPSNNNFDGAFNLGCLDSDDDQWRTASITPSSTMVVMMKGGPGGVIYSGLEAGATYDLDVGSRKGISHMEFCFSCSDLVEEAEQVIEEIDVTSNPTPYPTARPTTSAPTLPPPTTPNPTIRPPTTNTPTLEPLPTQCFDCGFETPPPKFQDEEEQQPQEEEEEEETEEEEEIVLISSTVAPVVPTPRPPLPDEIELISAQVETRSGASALVIHPGGWYMSSSMVGSFLLLTMAIIR